MWHAKGLPVKKKPFPDQPLSKHSDSSKKGWGLLWTLMGVFAAGIALNLTPCVYPLIPVTISYFAGQSSQGQSRLFIHGAFYVIGMALTNSILGVSAALTGKLMGALLQHPAVLVMIATIFVWGWGVGSSGVFWHPYTDELLLEAQQKNIPVSQFQNAPFRSLRLSIQFLRQTKILILRIPNVCLRLKFSPSLNLNKIEHFENGSGNYRFFGKVVCSLLGV
jgi:Cytochrome C biogenesis protein transmembrane region